MEYFKEDIKRAITSKTMILALILGLVLSLYPVFYQYSKWGSNQNYFYYFLTGYGYTPIGSFSLLLPCIAAMPYAYSVATDYNSGVQKYIFYRMNKKEYVIARILSNFIVSGGFVLVIQLINLTLSFILGNHNGAVIISRNEGFIGIDQGSIMMANIVVLINSFLFAGTYSTIGLGAAALVRNKYVSIIIPLIIYIGGSHIANIFNNYSASTTAMHSILDRSNNFKVLALYYIVFNIIGVLISYYSVCRKEDV